MSSWSLRSCSYLMFGRINSLMRRAALCAGRPERRCVEQNEGERRGEGGEYKKGSKGRGSPSFPSRVGEGNEGLWARAGPAGDITPPPSSSSILFVLPLHFDSFLALDWLLGSPWSMHVLQYIHITKEPWDSRSVSWIEPASSILRKCASWR